MITKRQFNILSYFLSRFLFFGGGISLLYTLGNVDTWIASLLGFILGLIAFKIIHVIQDKNNGKDIIYLLRKNIIFKILMYLLCFILLNDVLISVTVMTNSFFLFKTNPLLIASGLLLVIIYGVSKKEKVFARVAEILFPISIVVLIFKVLGYGSFALSYIDNLYPMFNTKIINFILCTLVSFIYSFVPNILLLSIPNMNLSYKEMIKGYVIAGISIVLTILIIGLIFGFPLASIIRYPEYMALKKISIFKVIKNIENILTVTWELDCIVSGFVIVNIMKKLNEYTFNKFNKISYVILLLISLLVSVYVFDRQYINTILIYRYGGVIFGILSLIILIMMLYKTFKKKNNQ